MRPDMFELLLERPRGYRGCRSRKAPPYPRTSLRSRNLEDSPLTEAMGFAYAEKSLNENLAPLARWLHQQVGRPWRLVYAEIAQHLSPKNAVKKHVRDHVADFVITQASDEHGILYGATRFGYFPLGRPGRWSSVLYVCPRTGLLRESPRPKRRSPSADVRPLADGRYLVRRKGVFYLVETEAGSPTEHVARTCALTGLQLGSAPYRHLLHAGIVPWGWDRIAVSAFVPRKKLLRDLFREAERITISARK